MIRTIIIVGVGGGIGSIARYLISLWAAKYIPAPFPYATFAINVLGSLLIGVFLGMLEKQEIANPGLRSLLVTGFCGGFTTFSTFASENFHLIQSGSYFTAAVYMVLSLLLGIIGVGVGFAISNFLG